ncbi:MAG: Hpt domain-containing protein [Sulfuritalea sp.]|jgi:chemotaxis protein histidine kinase CheA|nr:Hpt domain-containing protein [Sulfuritalea sp.]
MANPADLQAQLKVMRIGYAANLPGKLEEIERAWERLSTDKWSEDGIQAMHRMVHNLTGSGKTFGFALLSDVARELEEYLKQFAQAKTAPNEEQLSRIRGMLKKLRQVTLQRDAPGQSVA